MSHTLHLQADISIRRGQVRRRDFLKCIPAAALAAGAVSWQDAMIASAADLRRQGKACILLWMQGGPSQFETFSPLAGHANGGETKAIQTAASGIEISENLPETAKSMEHLCLIRSMTSKEGSHPRASYLMHTGYLPTATVKYPTLGSIVAKEIGDLAAELPSFVRIGVNRFGDSAGLLGIDYDPFIVQRAGSPPENTALATTELRYQRRLNLLTRLEAEFANRGGKQEVSDHQKVYAQAAKMITSPRMATFDLEKEPQKARDAYGSGPFGQGCLLARRLVEAGVTFVEVNLGNWDTHQDNFARSRALCGQLDQPLAALLGDLKQRGLLDSTLVVWTGEFGRTPRINPRGGRDHYPRAFSAALAGGGVKGGQVIGQLDAGGESVKDRPVGVADLFRTICHGLSIDAAKENMSSIGRPIKIVDGGEVVREVFG
ncbi:MAG: DUF1501 domain-containing protein [Planctomycetaceae bacterium]|nr:DUF1501 domain-containing protein [Planctomycetaceae bacterium]